MPKRKFKWQKDENEKDSNKDESEGSFNYGIYSGCYCLVTDNTQSKEMLELINQAIQNMTITVNFKHKIQWEVFRMYKQLEPVGVTLKCPKCGRRYKINFGEAYGYTSEGSTQ